MAEETVIARVARGIFDGALLVTAVALGFILVVDVATQLVDPSRACGEGPVTDCLVAIATGIFVGGIAGMAAKLPSRGVSLLRSIVLVAGFAMVARLATLEFMGFQKFGYPSAPAALAAGVGGLLVLVYGIVRSRSDE